MPIPKLVLDSIDNFVKFGKRPGGFVYAVLSNDLAATITSCDKDNFGNLKDIVLHVCNDIPYNCWGSKNVVEAWVSKQ